MEGFEEKSTQEYGPRYFRRRLSFMSSQGKCHWVKCHFPLRRHLVGPFVRGVYVTMNLSFEHALWLHTYLYTYIIIGLQYLCPMNITRGWKSIKKKWSGGVGDDPHEMDVWFYMVDLSNEVGLVLLLKYYTFIHVHIHEQYNTFFFFPLGGDMGLCMY